MLKFNPPPSNDPWTLQTGSGGNMLANLEPGSGGGGVSRRAILITSALAGAWLVSPLKSMALPSWNSGADLPRLKALLGQMTIEQKAGQLSLLPTAFDAAGAAFNPEHPGADFDKQVKEAEAGLVGGVLNGASIVGHRRLQEAAMRSPLKIPMIFGADIIHGYKTIFPVPLAEAASFDPALAERTSRIAAIEATANGLSWTFAPMVDLARDARWGRGVEGAGEDVLLGRDMAAARVRGFLGRRLSDDDSMLACLKHFAAYGAAEAGLDYAEVDLSERTLRDIYLPPFKAGFDAGALSTMAAFQTVNGVPASANRWLLDQVLREEWGFGGFVVSDWESDKELIAHGQAADERDAVRLAMLAGVDMSMGFGLYLKHLPDLVAKGAVPMARIDQAVLRVLTVKSALGLFDDPFGRLDPARPKQRVFTRENLAVARDAAGRSIVLLKNEGELLPLRRAGQRIALIGPFAEGQKDLNGPWTVFGNDNDAVDVASGLREALTDPKLLSVVSGSGVLEPLEGGIDAAVAAAGAADVVILAIGESQDMSGEAHSRAEVIVPQAQQALAEAVARTGKPVVVLLRTGRALALEGAVLAAPAILVTWFLGTQTGPAIADVVFGRVGPSARLPVSFPQVSGQAPYHYDHLPSGRPGSGEKPERYKTNFIEATRRARFPFGHGLTYGRISYAEFRQSALAIDASGSLEVSAIITNSGSRRATELVQLYLRDLVASVSRPVRQLKAYRRVDLRPGQSKTVTFRVGAADLTFVDQNGLPVLEPGSCQVWIAPAAEARGVAGPFLLTD